MGAVGAVSNGCVCAGGKLSNSGQITSQGDGEGQSLCRRALLARAAGALNPVVAQFLDQLPAASEGLSSPSRPPPSWPLDSGLSLARGRASSAPWERGALGGNANCPAASAGVLLALGNHKTTFLICEKSMRISQKEEGELGGSRCGSELKFLELSSFFLGAFLAFSGLPWKRKRCVCLGVGAAA